MVHEPFWVNISEAFPEMFMEDSRLEELVVKYLENLKVGDRQSC